LSAADAESGVAEIGYTTDGLLDPTASRARNIYTSPFTVTAPTTVTYYSWDKLGNGSPTSRQLIRVDTAPPVTTIGCNGTSCGDTAYSGPVSVSLTASDPASGVARTTYTTDGSDPTSSSTATAYTGPFTVGSTTTVRYYSTDVAGNAEAARSRQISVAAPSDTTAPSTLFRCNDTTCSTGWYQTSPVTVSLTATDNPGGSGVAVTRYTTDGSDPTSSATARDYSAPFPVPATATVKVESRDLAGNLEPTKSQTVRVDTTSPTTTIACGGTACVSTPYPNPVPLSLSATDSGGSGVARTVYTTDGSDPASSPTSVTYAGAFTFDRTSTIKWTSIDAAGNNEPVRTQVVQVASSSPGSKGSLVVAPSDDSYTAKGNPTATHGTEGSMNVDSGSSERRAYAKFTVTGIPAGATGVTATLRLYSQSGAPTTVSFPVNQVATTWNETGLTWNNQPALGPLLSTKTGLTNGAVNSFDLSNLITGNGTFAVAITSNNSTQRFISSKEATAAQRPQLALTWTNPN
jgi:hypothetical protein